MPYSQKQYNFDNLALCNLHGCRSQGAIFIPILVYKLSEEWANCVSVVLSFNNSEAPAYYVLRRARVRLRRIRSNEFWIYLKI